MNFLVKLQSEHLCLEVECIDISPLSASNTTIAFEQNVYDLQDRFVLQKTLNIDQYNPHQQL